MQLRMMAGLVAVVLAGGTISSVLAQEASAAKTDEKTKAATEKPADKSGADKPIAFVTKHSGKFNGQVINYTARAGETFIRDKDGKPIASFFTIAYTQDGARAAQRPVTFIFNGGPISASLWLHMGTFGPKRVVTPGTPGDDGAPPYPVVDNDETILDVSDIVFIDPVGTGYSRPLNGTDVKKFWGVNEDAHSFADFIETWVTENGRWNSPKYIAGESYGTVRAALLARELNDRAVGVNGVAFISTVLDYQNSRFSDGGIMAYVSFLPTYAATAWHHNKIPNKPADLAAFLAEVRQFARTDYALALIAGNRLDPAERARIRTKLAQYTGLSEKYLEQSDLRVNVFRFFKELLRDEGKVIGRFDGRYTGVEPDIVANEPEDDPSSYGIASAYVTALQTHLRDTLNVRMDRTYNRSADKAFQLWNWLTSERAPNGGRFVNVVPDLGVAMRQNKDLRVFVAAGYYDFATPFFGVENALSEAGVVPERIRYSYYPAGHMMYLDPPSRSKLLLDMRRFILDGKSKIRMNSL